MDSSNAINHNNHFHIYLSPPKAQAIEGGQQNLLTEPNSSDENVSDVSFIRDNETGETTMFLSMLVPVVSLATADIGENSTLVDSQIEKSEHQMDAILGLCEPVESPDNPLGQGGGGYLREQPCIGIGTIYIRSDCHSRMRKLVY